MTAALMKGMTTAYASGLGAVFTSWATYAVVATGVGGMFLLQNALQAGRLVAAQPGITLLDPVTAILWGVLAFNEHVNGGLWRALAGAGMLAMAGGALLLARTSLGGLKSGGHCVGELELPSPTSTPQGGRRRTLPRCALAPIALWGSSDWTDAAGGK